MIKVIWKNMGFTNPLRKNNTQKDNTENKPTDKPLENTLDKENIMISDPGSGRENRTHH